jgi:predicted ATPase
MSLADIEATSAHLGRVFFDRGLIDAAVALQRFAGEPMRTTIGTHRFHRRVFLTPPWRELYVSDGERQHGFNAAVEEYRRLLEAYPALGYEVLVLPKNSVAERAEFVLRSLR